MKYFSLSSNTDSFEILGFKDVENVDGRTQDEWINAVSAADAVIVGGGGLLNISFFGEAFEMLSRLKGKTKYILWGAGHNAEEIGTWRELREEYKTDLSMFDAVGVRDFGYRYLWVPCASCMLDIFNYKFPIKNRVVVYSHEFNNTEEDYLSSLPKEFPRLFNNASLEEAIEFIGSGDLVLTDCYHGAYWATLLGRRVVAFPRTSKFYSLRYPVPLCVPADWSRFSGLTRIYPEALSECRTSNVAFFSRVRELLSNDVA